LSLDARAGPANANQRLTIIAGVLRIGPIQLDSPVVQAALAGYSDGPMRLIARRLGAAYALHEVVLDKSIVLSPKARRKLLPPIAPQDRPLGGQLMGAEPGVFAAAAELLVAAGFDVVDLNFGCPVRKVLGRCRGGFLLSTPKIATEILRAVRGVVPPHIPVTVKMRRGMDDTAASEHNFFLLLDAAFSLGVAAVTVHGRTVMQHYRGPADWSFLARVKRHVGAQTILGSGDLFTAGHIQRMLETTGVDGVSVARGCIGNPWIFRDARALLADRPLPPPPSVAEQADILREHLRLEVAAHGVAKGTVLFRRFGIRYAEVHPHPKDVRAAFVSAWLPAEINAVLDHWYDPQHSWPPGRRKAGPSEWTEPQATGAAPLTA
jgi:nifR3 family TIM-barrel protein